MEEVIDIQKVFSRYPEEQREARASRWREFSQRLIRGGMWGGIVEFIWAWEGADRSQRIELAERMRRKAERIREEAGARPSWFRTLFSSFPMGLWTQELGRARTFDAVAMFAEGLLMMENDAGTDPVQTC